MCVFSIGSIHIELWYSPLCYLLFVILSKSLYLHLSGLTTFCARPLFQPHPKIFLPSGIFGEGKIQFLQGKIFQRKAHVCIFCYSYFQIKLCMPRHRSQELRFFDPPYEAAGDQHKPKDFQSCRMRSQDWSHDNLVYPLVDWKDFHQYESKGWRGSS